MIFILLLFLVLILGPPTWDNLREEDAKPAHGGATGYPGYPWKTEYG